MMVTLLNRRIWTRHIDDTVGGPMSSMHTHITIDKDKGELRGDLMFRDCHECITFSYWITRRRRHKTKAIKALYKIRAEIDRFIEAYEKGAEELSHNGTLKR